MNLKDKTILVTGASGDIGYAIANAFARKKSKLILHGRDESSINKIKSELGDKNIECMLVTADFRKVIEISKMFAEIKKKCQRIDILVNVSGIEKMYVDPMDTTQWKDVMDVNLFGAVECSREAIKMMGETGLIVNISSIAGKVGIAFTGASLPYAISKAALNTFSENLAAMVAPRIRVVAVSPGYTMTPLWEMYTEEEKEECLRDVLLKRFVTPKEVAQAVIAVAENDAITATNIVVDAGLTLKEIK
jgi:3-oxoacyl-[acyl-carrier protein] reductase